MKTTLLLISVIAPALLNGCIGIMPVPPNSEAPTMGTPIASDQTKFIVPGRTTREEVIAHLGDHYRESPRMPVMAYSWEKPTWGYCWWVFLIVPTQAPFVIKGGDYEEGNDWQALYLKYDFAGRVEKAEFAKLDNNYSLDEQMENWGWGKSRGFFDFLEDGAGVINPKTGTPLPFDWMKGNLEIKSY